MTIPKYMLPDRVTIVPYLGVTALAKEKYGDSVEDVPCRMFKKTSVVKDAQGVEVVSQATVLFQPNVDIGPKYRVVSGSTSYEVVNSSPQVGFRRVHHIEAALK